MKRSLLAALGLSTMMMVGCSLNSESNFEANMEYLYGPTVNLLDTTYIDEDVKDVKYSIDTMLFNAMGKEELSGSAFFQASGSNVYEVDSILNSKATAVYNTLVEDIHAFDYASFFNSKVTSFKGNLEVVYCVQCTSYDKALIRDTINIFSIEDQQ